MAVEKRPVSAEALIRHASKMVETQAHEQGVVIETHLAPGLGEISLDFDRMSQVLLNLFLNSLEAMPEGGTLSVDTDLDSNGNRALIRVSDTGTGISREHLVNVFDPIFHNKGVGHGSWTRSCPQDNRESWRRDRHGK